jgi:DNA ligase-1
MQKVIEIINEIANTSGRNDKEAILESNKDNELLKKVLKFVFDPFIVTGLSTKKINKSIKPSGVKMFIADVEHLLEHLSVRNTGTDTDIELVQNFINNHYPHDKDILIDIVTKNLKIGLTDKTLNKVFGKGFIDSFSCMLAEKYFEHEAKVTGEFIITTKLDGLRCLLFKENGTVKLFSRTGQLYEGLIEIEEEAKNLPDEIVLDGELILRNDKSLNSADLFRGTQKTVRKDGIKKNVEFHVFDGLTVTSFKNGIDKSPCIGRKAIVEKYINDGYYDFIKYVKPLYVGNDKSVIPEMLTEIISSGHEGLMYSVANAPYECKRTRTLLKIKVMETLDLKVIGFEEGTGKYVGKLGRMDVFYRGFTVGVGSGFTDQDREEIWSNQDKYLGKIAEIQYFEKSMNQEGGLSLRFPVFKCFRYDLECPDML